MLSVRNIPILKSCDSNRKGDHHMFSLTSPNVTRTQLGNSSARLSRRMTHSVKIISAAAIALLAAGNNLANATENPARTAQEQHACAVVRGLDPLERRYDACIRSLDRSLSEWDYARLVSTDHGTCAQEGLQPGMPAFATCVVKAQQFR
jgi:hypothetical protein